MSEIHSKEKSEFYWQKSREVWRFSVSSSKVISGHSDLLWHILRVMTTSRAKYSNQRKKLVLEILLWEIVSACMLSHFNCVWLSAILWTIAIRLLCPWGFFRPEYWNGLPCPPLKDLPDPAIEPAFLMSPAWAGVFLTASIMWEAQW